MHGVYLIAAHATIVVACSSPTRRKPEPTNAIATTERSSTPPAAPSTPATEPSWTPQTEPAPTDRPLSVVSGKPERCSVRVTDRGITVDGDAMGRGPAVAVCKQRSAALVELADGANEAEWKQLRAALVAAGVKILMRGAPAGDGECANNPLAKGCM